MCQSVKQLFWCFASSHRISNEIYWFSTISGKLDNMKKDIRPWGITTDGKTGVFICDISNDHILLVSLEGHYLGTVLRSGQCELGAPWRLGWCRTTGSLIVQDVKDEESCISVVTLKKPSWNAFSELPLQCIPSCMHNPRPALRSRAWLLITVVLCLWLQKAIA